MHEDDEWARILILHHQCLDDLVLVDTELPRGLRRAAMLDVVIQMFGERDAVLA